MRFDQTKQIFGFNKTNVDKTKIDFGLQPQGNTGSLASGGSGSDKPSANDNAPVEYRAQDKRSFEELVRNQIQLHEANAAASATPVKGTTTSVAQALEAVDVAETCAEVDEAFGQLDGIIVEKETEGEQRQSVVDSGPENDNAQGAMVTGGEVADGDAGLGDMADADADDDGAVAVDVDVDVDVDDEQDDERDTLKPPRPVEGIQIKMIDSRPPLPTMADNDDDWSEVSLEDLVELTDGQLPSDSLVDVMAAKSMRDDVPMSRNKNKDVPAAKRSGASGQQRSAGPFERTSLTGAPASDDELQIVRTSFPPPSVSHDLRRSHNPWKIVALAALFVLAVMLGWNLRSQSNGFFNNAFSDFPGGRFSGETQDSQPRFAQTSISGDEQLAVVSERENDMTAEIRLPHGGAAEIDSAESVGAQWRRRDVENPRKKRHGSGKSDRRSGRAQKDKSAANGSGPIASVIPGENGASESDTKAISGAEEPAVTSAIPALPSKSDVRDAMREIDPMIRSCRIDASGRLVLKMVVSGASGKIISSEVVDEKFRGTSTGRCAVRAAQNAKLPIFQKKKLTITYPFNI